MAVQKKGLDYFPLSTEFDDSIELIIAEFGMTGLGILIKLWQKIYAAEGYYCVWNEDVALMFSRRCGEGVNVVSEVIKGCLRRGVFDKALFEKYSILTSKGIQERYLEACSRRKSLKMISEYLLGAIPENCDNVCILNLNAYISGENAVISQQSKVKENKVNKNKVNKIKEVSTDAENNLLIDYSLNELNSPCPDFQLPVNCSLSVAEYDFLYRHIPEKILIDYMSRVGKYDKKGHFGYIMRWAQKDGYWLEKN